MAGRQAGLRSKCELFHIHEDSEYSQQNPVRSVPLNSSKAVTSLDPDSSQVTLQHLTHHLRRLIGELFSQCRQGWDINVMLRIHAELGQLANQHRQLGHVSLQEQLLAIQTALTPALTRTRVPDSGTTALVAALTEHLQKLLPSPQAEQPGAVDQAHQRLAGQQRARILVVGLSAEEAHRVLPSLEAEPDFEVLHLPEPLAVLEQLTRFSPNLIALNMHMKVCDSADLASMIREREDCADLPIVHLVPGELPEAGVSDVVSMAQSPEQLIADLQRRLAQTGSDDSQALPDFGNPGHYRRAWLLDRLEACLNSTEAQRGGLLDIAIDKLDALKREYSAAERRAIHAQLGQLIAQCLEPGDMLGENGAGFLLLCRDRGRENMHALAQELMGNIRSERFGARALPLTVSMGGCILSEDLDEADAVLNSAYRARRAAGPGQIGWHDNGDGCLDPLMLENALRNERMHLVFQAIVDLGGGHMPQYQALVRLRDNHGFVHTAAELLPLARRAGLVPNLDLWSLDAGLKLLAEHQRQTRPLHLFISQSSESLNECDYPARLGERLRRYGARGARLVLEFRCDDISDSPRELLRVAPRIKALGVGLCLSGVDRGLRAAQLLDALPLDYIKLAPSLNDNPGALVPIAHARDIAIIATQVEEHSQLRRLEASGVDYAQGHSLAHPSRSLNYRFAASA